MAKLGSKQEVFTQFYLDDPVEGAVGGIPPVINEPITPTPSGATVLSGNLESPNFVHNIKGWRLRSTGDVEFGGAIVRGTIIATAGTIGGWTISANDLSSGNIYINGLTERMLFGVATAPLVGTGVFLGKDGADYEFRAGNPAGAYMHWDGSSLNISGSKINAVATGSEVGIQGWLHTMVFSITDLDTVAWASGTITLTNGDTYSISAGNTGNMAAETYVYLDIATSTTVLQTTTTKATSVGTGKILIAVCKNGTVEPTFTVFSSNNQNIDASSLVKNSITANEIAANTITATEMSVSQLSAIAADLGTITAGNMTVDASGYIKGGQSGYDSGTGFWLGYNEGKYKFSIGIGGTTANNMTWDGITLTINGYTLSADVDYIAGDILIASADTEREVNGSFAYAKKKEIAIVDKGQLRIKFDLRMRPDGGVAYGRIYVNGIAVGTERTTTSETYITYSEDISGLVRGDLVQLYVKAILASGWSNIKNFRLYNTSYEVATVLLD